MEIKKKIEQKTATVLLALGLGSAALVGCGANAEIKDNVPAKVLGHDYTAPYTTFIPVGKIIVPQFHPAEYDLEVRQCDRVGDEGADKDGCVTAQVSVDEDTYNDHPDGSEIVFHG